MTTPEPRAPAVQTLLNAVAVTGPGATMNLSGVVQNSTMQIIPGGTTPDMGVIVRLEGSLDGQNWDTLVQGQGPGLYSDSQHAIQYIRANVLSLASGNVTVLSGST